MLDTGGFGVTFAGIVGVGIVDIQFDSTSLGPKGWFRKKVVGLSVYHDTPYPARTGCYAAEYRVHWMGPHPDWGNWGIDDNDNGDGDDRDPVQITICKA